jgi:uncharacterized RDD family membrane protein YckC
MTADVVTGEAVVLDVRLARWPSRMVAFVIDAVVLYLVLVIAVAILTSTFSNTDADGLVALWMSTVVVVFVGIPLTVETLSRGRSLGKLAVGIRIVRDDGGPIQLRHAVARSILMPLEFWGPALIASIVSKRGKRLGDLLAGTIAVRTRVPAGNRDYIAMPPPLAGWAQFADVGRVPDDLAHACRQYLERQSQMSPAARESMGAQLAGAVQAVVGPPPPGTPAWAYLAAVLAERRRREWLRMSAQRAAANAAAQAGSAPSWPPAAPSWPPAPPAAPASAPAPPAPPAPTAPPPIAPPQLPGPFAPPT